MWKGEWVRVKGGWCVSRGRGIADTPLLTFPFSHSPFPQSLFDRVVDDLADDARREVPLDVRVRVVGEPPPELRVTVEPYDSRGEVLRRVGDQCLLAVPQRHAFGPDCGRDDGDGVGERLADLALDARAEADGRDEDARAREQRVNVGHVAEQTHAFERRELRRRVVADDK